MKKKYLFLITSNGMGGAEHFLLDYFRYIDFEQYSITLATNKNPYKTYLEDLNLPIDVIKLPILGKNNDYYKFKEYLQFFKRINPHCIVFNQFKLQSFSLPEIIAARIFKNKCVHMIIHSHPYSVSKYKPKLYLGLIPGLGIQWRKLRLYQRLLQYFCSHILVVSDSIQETLVNLHKYSPSKLKLVNHGVNTNVFKPSQNIKLKVRDSLKISLEDTVIISTCRLAPVKRIDRIITTFNFHAEINNNIHLLLLGTGESHDELLESVKKLSKNIRSRIKFLGFQKDVVSFLQASDIYMLTSDSEGFPIASLEAMSCSLIPIITDCGGPREIIRDINTGFLTEKNTESVKIALGNTLELSNNEKLNISKNCRDLVKKHYELKDRVSVALRELGITK